MSSPIHFRLVQLVAICGKPLEWDPWGDVQLPRYTRDAERVSCEGCVYTMAKLVERSLKCRHRSLAGRMTNGKETYAVCTDCGESVQVGHL